MRLFVCDHIIRSEFIAVGRHLYQLPVVCVTIVLVAISPVFYLRCQILVVSYSVISCQLSYYQPVLTSAVIGDISYYYIITHIDCLLIKDTITWGKGVIA